MCKQRYAIFLLASVGQLCRLTFAMADDTAWVRVVPEETNEILANPGMGWETFHRTANNDKNLPSWIPSTVHYARWGWRELEPEQGQIAYDMLDGVLKETREAGQKLAFRVMCCSPNKGRPYHPAWLKEVGGRELMADYNSEGPFPIPDMDDPIILDAHLDFITRLGERYDGHPDIDHVDLGSIGWWGEWHLSGSKNCKVPMLENRMKVVDAYLNAFKKTPLVMLINGQECTAYATQHGTGWRADSMGDLGSFSPTWNHMRDAYPKWIREAQAEDAWKNGPIAYEPPLAVAEFVEKDRPLRWIFNYALACHGSLFSGKSGRLPDNEEFRQELERFLRRLGYRLVLRELTHPAQVRPGDTLELRMKWQNIGSAPCYGRTDLLTDLRMTRAIESIVGTVTVNKWRPGPSNCSRRSFSRSQRTCRQGRSSMLPIRSSYHTICHQGLTPCPSPLLAPKTPNPLCDWESRADPRMDGIR